MEKRGKLDKKGKILISLIFIFSFIFFLGIIRFSFASQTEGDKTEIIAEEVTSEIQLYLEDTPLEIYEFEKSEHLFKEVNSYDTNYLICPKNLTISAIKKNIEKATNNVDNFNKKELNKMLDDCKKFNSFKVPAKLIEPEMEDCINMKKNLLKTNNILTYPSEDLIKECIIERHFQEKYAKDKAYLNKLFSERDENFVKEIIMKDKFIKELKKSQKSGKDEKDKIIPK